jgi:hypothetical protein
MILAKNYNSLNFQDIERLVNNKIAESKTLDYKREINIDKGEERKDFLFDIASFANSEGGVIIYGIAETKDNNGQNTGLPEEITGLNIDNFDKLIQKIEDLINSSIEPSIPNITIKPLTKDEKNLLLIGIPKPMGLPRMVTYNSSNKFYKRRNSGKYLLDIFELNQLFMNSYELLKQIEDFRQERISDVLNLKFLIDIEPKNASFIHITPLSFYAFNQLSLTDDILIDKKKKTLKPISDDICDGRYNFEGYLVFQRNFTERKIEAYTQIFRNGIIEFYTHAFHTEFEKRKMFYLDWFEDAVLDYIKAAMNIYMDCNVQPPFVIHLSIFDMFQRYVAVKGERRINNSPFMTDNIIIPNVVVNDYEVDISKELKSTFDIIWQSAGIRESPYYNALGKRITK